MKSISDIDPNMAVKDPDVEGIVWYSPLNKNMFKILFIIYRENPIKKINKL